MRNFERMYSPEDFLEDQPDDHSYYTISNHPNIELWECHPGSIADFREQYNMEYYLTRFWNNQFEDDHALSSPMTDEIMIGKRLFTFGHTVYKCVAYPSSSSKLDMLVALSLPTRTPGVIGTYFGEIILFFAHKFEGTVLSIIINVVSH